MSTESYLRVRCLAHRAHHYDQGTSSLRPLDPTAASKMLEFKHLDTEVMVCMTLLHGRVVCRLNNKLWPSASVGFLIN